MTITARYTGVCGKCLRLIEPGHRLDYVPGRPVEHADCSVVKADAVVEPDPRYFRSCGKCGAFKTLGEIEAFQGLCQSCGEGGGHDD